MLTQLGSGFRAFHAVCRACQGGRLLQRRDLQAGYKGLDRDVEPACSRLGLNNDSKPPSTAADGRGQVPTAGASTFKHWTGSWCCWAPMRLLITV